jgi:hypothetical protein
MGFFLGMEICSEQEPVSAGMVLRLSSLERGSQIIFGNEEEIPFKVLFNPI